MPDPLDILESSEGGGEGGRILWGGIHRFLGRDSWRPAIPSHFQRFGRCGSATLGFSDGEGRGRAGRARTRGQTSKFPLLQVR